jgi:hypothetical protein
LRDIQSAEEEAMKGSMRHLIVIAGIVGLGLMPLSMAWAASQSLEDLSAEWWQWESSIPNSVKPTQDSTGADCMVGQRGATWFLTGAGVSGTVTRSCAIPQGVTLFFPVIGSVNVNTPNICAQDANNIPVVTLRSQIAPFIDGATKLSLKVDNRELKNLIQRVQSSVFAMALPEDNGFDAPCAAFGGVPAGVYSPAVADGLYVDLSPLTVGSHTLEFHAENPGANFELNVTYNLTVVPVLLK